MKRGTRIDIFEFSDVPSARFMAIKAACLQSAGVISVSEAQRIIQQAATLIRSAEKASELGSLPIHFLATRYSPRTLGFNSQP